MEPKPQDDKSSAEDDFFENSIEDDAINLSDSDEGVSAPEQPKQPSSKSKKSLIVVLILLFFVVVGAGAWLYGQNQATKSKEAEIASLQKELDALSSNKNEESSESVFTSDVLGLKLTYPKSWGDASLKKGEVVSPGTGDYQQLTFSNIKDVDINFVIGGFTSPLDGCPTPEISAPHDLSQTRASVIGWESNSLKKLYKESENGAVTIIPQPSEDVSLSYKWVAINKEGGLLVYKDKDQTPYEPATEGNNACQTITQKQADAANKYYQYTRFALNYNNKTVKGVNAQLNTANGSSDALQNELKKVLLSVTNN